MDHREQAASVDREERALVLARFDHDDAWWLGSHLRDVAAAQSAPLAIEIRRGATRIFGALLPGATADNLAWIDRKIAVAARFERASYAVALQFRGGEGLFERFGLDPRRHAASGGAVPIRVASAGIVGFVAASGLAQDVDHRMVVDALSKLQAHQAKA